jgi:predicted enzyme related to lactoylglutathione lyase
MLRFRHYTVAVHDLDEAVANHQSRFAMQPVGERGHNRIGNFDYQPMGYDGNVMLHLIRPSTEDGPIAKLMKERVNPFNPHGEGIYLLAYDCDDVDAFCAQIEAAGGRVTRAPGASNAWVHPTSSNFVLMELFPAKRE